MKIRIPHLLAREWRRSPISFRRLVDLGWSTLLHLYLVLSLPLLAWLNWQPENNSAALSFPERFVVEVDGEVGLSDTDYCAFGIAWHGLDWLGFDVRIPNIRDGHMLSCEVKSRVMIWDEQSDAYNGMDEL